MHLVQVCLVGQMGQKSQWVIPCHICMIFLTLSKTTNFTPQVPRNVPKNGPRNGQGWPNLAERHHIFERAKKNHADLARYYPNIWPKLPLSS